MFYPGLALTLSIVLLLVLIVGVAMRPDHSKIFVRIAMLCSAISGVCIYSMGYCYGADNPGQIIIAIFRAATNTLFMYSGRDNYSGLISSWPYFANNIWIQVLFWIIHMLAIYAAVTTVLSAVGQSLIRTLRLVRYRLGKSIILIKGVNDEVFSMASELIPKHNIVIIGDLESDTESRADKLNILCHDIKNLDSEGKWLSRFGITKGKHIEIICLETDDTSARAFLDTFISSARKKKLRTSDIHISVICSDEYTFSYLHENPSAQLEDGKYLMADILTYPSMSASVMMKNAPVWEAVDFKNGEVHMQGSSDPDKFSVIIIGFGSVGEEVLRQIARNCAYLSSTVDITVVDKAGSDCGGLFEKLYHDMIRRYNISLKACSLGSSEFADLLYEKSTTLVYVAACTGDDKTNSDAASIIRKYLYSNPDAFHSRLTLCKCGKDHISVTRFTRDSDSHVNESVLSNIKVLNPQDLVSGQLDEAAISVNASYVMPKAKLLFPNDPAKQKDYCRNSWYNADFISRESSRASAFYISSYPYMFHSAGYNDLYQKALADTTTRMKLAEAEHLRWCAFESSIGVIPMDETEFIERIKSAENMFHRIIPEVEAMDHESDHSSSNPDSDKVSDIAEYMRLFNLIRKETPLTGIGGIHICLTDWDNLDHLWDLYKEADYHKKLIDYHLEHARWLNCEKNGTEPSQPVPADQVNFKDLDMNTVMGELKRRNEVYF